MIARTVERLAARVATRPLAALLVLAVLVAGGAAAAVSSPISAGVDQLGSPSSPAAQATEEHRQRFGDDPVIVLVREPLTRLLLTSDVSRLLALEGCLSGRIPRGAKPIGGPAGPCVRLARARAVRVVYGPATFLNEAAIAVDERTQGLIRRGQAQAAQAALAAGELARAQGRTAAQQTGAARSARALAEAQLLVQLRQLQLRSGLPRLPRLDDPDFVSAVVFDPARGAGTPKARFSSLFPGPDAAAVQVRLRAGLTDAQRHRAIALVREITGLGAFRLRNGGSYRVSGAPALADGLTHSLSRSLLVLLAAALVLMALTLALVFRARQRLLPLAVALAAVALTFGVLALTGGSLTMAAVAALPVLLGLGVDYAVQLQSRMAEAEAEGDGTRPALLGRAAARAVPGVAAAALATMGAFAVLLLSPLPMVRGFGALLVGGVLVAVLVAFVVVVAALALRRRGASQASRHLDAATEGARELLAQGADGLGLGRARHALQAAAGRRARALAVAGVLLALAGWIAQARAPVVSDLQRLVPADLPALRDLDVVQRETGVAGEADVVVHAHDVTRPDVLSWMIGFETAALRRHGYDDRSGCGRAALCPALSISDLAGSGSGSGPAAGARGKAVLDALPPYLSQAIVTPDRRVANLSFGVRLMPLSDQQALFDDLRERLRPPAGVSAELGGLPVLAAEANAALTSPVRRLSTLLLGLLAVGVVLLAVLRDPRRALVPLVPVALTTGWSALLLTLLRVELNPMSVALGALVMGISTEFSVLLSERYHSERARTGDRALALRRAYASTGTALAASGTAAVVGFAVLLLSDVRLLSGFGAVTVVDLAASLVGVLAILPVVIALAEGNGRLGRRRSGARRVGLRTALARSR